MPFSETSTSLTIAKGVLSAQCKKADGKHSSHASISLNDYIGNSDGKLTWGGKGFSHYAEDVHVNAQGILSAKLKGHGGKMIESQLDLNKHIRNNDGVLEPIPIGSVVVDEAKLVAPSMSRVLSTASTASEASASSLFSSVSAASSQTTVSTSVNKTSSSSYSSSTFHSSKFRATSKLLLIEATCTDLILKGTILHLKCQKLDGSVVESSINLDEIIGFINGRLEWDYQGFSKHVTQFYLEGFILIAKYTLKGSDQVHIAQIDLRTRLRNSDGVVILMELNKKLSVMLSEVPWMKFKVIAEPDLSVFAKHPVMQETLTRIAETTVEHVTTQMHQMLTIAMESAIQAITQSAMEHVQSQMQTLVADVAGYANASASITAAESLRLYGQGGYAVGGYAAGGYSAGGYYSGGFISPGLSPGLYVQGGAAHSGILNGNGHGVYTPLQSPSIHLEQHGHEHASYSEVASHATQAGHSVSGSLSATQSAAAIVSV